MSLWLSLKRAIQWLQNSQQLDRGIAAPICDLRQCASTELFADPVVHGPLLPKVLQAACSRKATGAGEATADRAQLTVWVLRDRTQASEVRRDAVLFPVAVAGGIGSVAATDFLGRRRADCPALVGQPAALLRFCQPAAGLRRQPPLRLGIFGLLVEYDVQPALISGHWPSAATVPYYGPFTNPARKQPQGFGGEPGEDRMPCL